MIESSERPTVVVGKRHMGNVGLKYPVHDGNVASKVTITGWRLIDWLSIAFW